MNLDEHMKFDTAHTFVTSDHHFGSWKRAPYPWRGSVFSQPEEEELIAKWNSVVRPTDQIFYVGDFCDSGETDFREYRKRLNGKILLIKGNHDNLSNDVYKAVCTAVCDELVIDALNLVLRHCPDIERNKAFRQIYGHEHIEGGQLHPMDPARSFCSCVMRNEGFPVTLEAALANMDAMVCRTNGIQR